MKVNKNIQFPIEMIEELEKVAKREGSSLAAIVRRACAAFLHDHG